MSAAVESTRPGLQSTPDALSAARQSATLSYYSAIRCTQEIEQFVNGFLVAVILFDANNRTLQIELRTIEASICASQLRDGFVAEAASPEPLRVDAVRARGIASRNHERWYVLQADRTYTSNAVGTDTTELVNQREATKYCVRPDVYMPCQTGAVRENCVVIYVAVVGDMHVGHEKIIVTDSGLASMFRGAAIYRAELAKDISVADAESRIFASISRVLRFFSNRTVLKNTVVLANAGVGANNDVRPDFRVIANFDTGFDNCKRANMDIGT